MTRKVSCLVIGPFGVQDSQFDEVYELLIKPATSELPINLFRLDRLPSGAHISNELVNSIATADVCIVDLTHNSAVSYYVCGRCHESGKALLILQRADTAMPFDISSQRVILYDFEDPRSLLRTRRHIEDSLSQFLEVNASSGAGGESIGSLAKMIRRMERTLDAALSAKSLAPAADHSRELAMLSSPERIDGTESHADLHLRAELSTRRGDKSSARTYLSRALLLARASGGDADEIGNCAIEAERSGFDDLAEGLYQAALQQDPEHVNNRQCYVSFLLDSRKGQRDALELADRLLISLESSDRGRTRTKALRTQWQLFSAPESHQGESIAALTKALLSGGDNISLSEAAPLLIALQRSGDLDSFSKLLETIKQKTPEQDRWQLDRALADGLAVSDDQGDRDRAISLYRALIESGKDDSAAAKHNLATLLYSQNRKDPNDEALALWASAYNERPQDGNIRRAFSQYLIRRGRHQDAEIVMEGTKVFAFPQPRE